MKVAIIGLGKMGEALAYRMLKAQYEVFGFDVNHQSCTLAEKQGVCIVSSLNDFKNNPIDVFWLMIPQGSLVDKIIDELRPSMRKGTIVVDGGNSKFTDSMRRAQDLAVNEIYFMDCGTSGGIHGRENGFCLMVGGDKKSYDMIEPLLGAIAAPGGYAYIGRSGTGHYIKMVHNGIEYGLLQAYAEGFHLLKDGEFKNELDLDNIAQLWNNGSVIRSWILELVQSIMEEDQALDDIKGDVASTGMGKWTVEQAHRSGIPVSIIEKSLEIRELSQRTGGNYATKVVAMLRNKFGGHSVTKKMRENS